jgi:hypothetical protein
MFKLFYIMRNYQLLLESQECVKQIGYGHQCLREEKLSFKNNYIEHCFISCEISNFFLKAKSVWNKSAMVTDALERRSLVLKIIILNIILYHAKFKIMFNIIIFKTKPLLSKALVTIADLLHTLLAFKKKLVISHDIK